MLRREIRDAKEMVKVDFEEEFGDIFKGEVDEREPEDNVLQPIPYFFDAGASSGCEEEGGRVLKLGVEASLLPPGEELFVARHEKMVMEGDVMKRECFWKLKPKEGEVERFMCKKCKEVLRKGRLKKKGRKERRKGRRRRLLG